MKLLLDEHFSQQIAVALRGRGHDALAVAEPRVHAGSLIDLLADVCADNPSDEDIKSKEIWLAPPA